MKHAIKQKKMDRDSAHRIALLRNMADSLIKHERIKLTLPKAKFLRPYVERLVTLAKKNNLVALRRLRSFLYDKDNIDKLLQDVAPRFKEREGGYVRIVKLGYRRGDAAPMAYIEFVDYLPKQKVIVEQEDEVASSGNFVG